MVEITYERRIKQQKPWEDYISRGLEAREHLDTCQWELGDIAGEVATEYGKDSIGAFAKDICIPKKTILNYRTVAQRFDRNTRQKYRKLSFSHFRVAASLEAPEAWLEKADDGNWTVEKTDIEIKKAYGDIVDHGIDDPPPKVYRCPECNKWRLENTSRYEVCTGHYVIDHNQMVYK